MCTCGERYQQVFPASVSFSVYFDKSRTTSPVDWKADKLAVCLFCGEVAAHVPEAALKALQGDGSTGF